MTRPPRDVQGFRRRRVHGGFAATTAVAVAMVLAACSAEHKAEAPALSSTPTTSPTSSTLSPADAPACDSLLNDPDWATTGHVGIAGGGCVNILGAFEEARYFASASNGICVDGSKLVGFGTPLPDYWGWINPSPKAPDSSDVLRGDGPIPDEAQSFCDGAPTATPTPSAALAGGIFVDTQTADGSPATISIAAKKLGGPAAPFKDGAGQPASAVAFKLTIVDISGDAFLDFTSGGFSLDPSNGGPSSIPEYNSSNDENKALEKRLCKGTHPLFFDPGSANSSGWDLSEGSTYSGCVVFDYFGKALPTTLSYADGQSNVARQKIWTGKVGRGPAATMKPPPPPPSIYKVTSDGGINSVTYSTASFSQAQDTDVAGNTWTKNIPAGTDIPVLVAQNAGGASISCTIIVDGHQVDHETSHGQYAVVTCTGS